MFFLLFPGQGSQQPGMGRLLFDNFSVARETFEEASDSLGFDLQELCFNGSEADLALTENTQPALLATSTAASRVLKRDFGIQTVAVAGHSIGEYAALVAVESLKFSDAMKAVRIRGQAMQAAVPVGMGGMAAVLGLEPEQVIELCRYVIKESKLGPLSPANFNCPGQIVISGSKTAIQWTLEHARPEVIWPNNPPKRMKLIPLQVSAPFHCEMMKPAEERMRQVLTGIDFKDAKIPVIQNFTAQVETKGAALRENLIRQVSAPVLWMQSMTLAQEKSWKLAIECGSGKVVQGLLKKISTDFQVFSTNTLDDLKAIEKVMEEK
jgi:[acyl-carrier-protein] S-malonyltransferase